ncbi:MAG TPA: tetratricopeptide repeat protein, partial [Thermoanaerobaculia bacterium]
MDTSLRNRVRERLSRLQSDNGETLFEQVCAEIARRRIHANIKMSSFVAGHGDKGRDFENVPGYDPLLVGSRGKEDGLRPDDTIVGACTLGRSRSDPSDKIRSDVLTIHEKGPKPQVIYYFCETDFPTATQTKLCNWSAQTYGTRLHIVTGNTLSDWLSEADLAAALNLLGLAANPPAPRCVLPPVNTEGFVGRRTELERLTKSLIDGDTLVGGRIAGLYGPPGVGKSGLAVYFASLNRDRFPGGVIGVDLRGVDDPIDALARLAIALDEPLTSDEQGCPPHQIAQSRLAHLRCLILLDNLEHGSALKQIRPGGRAAVLITCRDQDVLAKFAVPAEHRLPVERLPRAEAVTYLQSALGSAIHNTDELDTLAEALRDLPLALRIGARRVMEDPIVSGRIERFVARLRSPTRIGELSVPGEADLDLVPLFDLSIESLSDGERRAFACLSVCTPKGFGTRAAAAAMDLPDPMPLVSRLARLSLLEVDQSTTRFRFHALVDDYTWHLADHWGLAPAARARHAQAMADLLRDNANAQGADLVELLADQEDIRHGLEHFADTGHIDLQLLQGLTCLVEQTALGDWHSSLLARLRERLAPDSQTWIGAVLLLQQGKRDLALGRLEDARVAFERSLEIHRARKDQRGEAMVLNSLGGVLRDLGRLEDAHDTFERSLKIHRARKDQRGEAMVLNSLGGLLRDLGRLEDARDTFERSLEIRRALNDQHGEAMVLNSLGGALRDLGQLDEARAALERSLKIGRALNDRRHEAMVLNSLGWLYRELGDPNGALNFLNAGRAISKDLGSLAPASFRRELKMLRQWSRQLATGTHKLARYHLAMEKRRVSAQDWHGAIVHMRRNLELDGDGSEQHDRIERLAYACFRAQRLPEAIDAYHSALEIGPISRSMGYANLGRALHLVGGDLTEAEGHLRKACELQPDNAWARSWLGLLLADNEQMDEGERHARRALIGNEQHAVLLHNLAQVLARFPDTRRDKL